MDFVAEIVLGYVDEQINLEIGDKKDIRILRYRDDYRIFAIATIGLRKSSRSSAINCDR
jgi:hypothetical protein